METIRTRPHIALEIAALLRRLIALTKQQSAALATAAAAAPGSDRTGLQRLRTTHRIRIDASENTDGRTAKKTRVFYVHGDQEIDISACVKRAVVTLDVNEIPLVELTCHAELDGSALFDLSPDQTAQGD